MNLILILGDQLNKGISSLAGIDKVRDVILMCEVWEDMTYVKHHKKKIAFILSTMRHFAEELKKNGYNVHYIKLDNCNNTGLLYGEVKRTLESYKVDKLIVTEPSEYRIFSSIKTWKLPVCIEVREDDRFLCTHKEFEKWAHPRKKLNMEYFYREVRKKYSLLMKGEDPEGGQWNYDSENRNPPQKGISFPQAYKTNPDSITHEVKELVLKNFSEHFGNLEPFYFAVTREQALNALDQFIQERLINFGTYQDAMVQGEPWMYHSHLSAYINCGLLLPLECVQAAEKSYQEGKAPLNAVEGFMRQIIGWREYVRGVYWLKMPEYAKENFLNAHRKLPSFFWGAGTDMNCLHQCIKETKENAYAHHIQRLMVLGNFALISGIHPDEVNAWYLIVYADAYQWVELPNVTGMTLFADGGTLGSKPYAASGSYINKMSNYCKSCRYKVREKKGKNACPFNYLYWDFLLRNQKKLKGHYRLRMIYDVLARMEEQKVRDIQEDSQKFLKALDRGVKV